MSAKPVPPMRIAVTGIGAWGAIKAVETKLAAFNRNHKLLGAKPAGLQLEQKYQRTLYELQHPEVLREPSINEARSMCEKSEVCTTCIYMYILPEGQTGHPCWIHLRS